MIAERVPGSPILRVYDDGGSYARGSPIRFMVACTERRYRPGVAYLEGGIGEMAGEIWRAIEQRLFAEGYYLAEWEVVDRIDGYPRPRKVVRKVRNPVACAAPSGVSTIAITGEPA